MKIAIIAPAWFAVPPTGYGGIEWVVALLADGLVDAGHDVTNDHSGQLGAVLGAAVDTAVVHTVHGPLGGEPGEIYDLIGKVAPQVGLISISMNQRKPKPHLNWIANCHNALDFSIYPFKPTRGD